MQLFSGLFGWLFGCLVVWLFVLLVGWLVGWLVSFALVWVWFDLIRFGLVDFSFNASLEPKPRARRRARPAEDALLATRFALSAPGPTPGPHVRLNAG